MKNIIILAIMALFSLSLSAKGEVKTVTFHVPQLECQNCEAKVKKNISFEKGVKSFTTNVEKRSVTITYNPAKTTVEKLQAGFKKFGYTATVAPAKCEKSACAKAGSCCKKEEKCCEKKADTCCKKEEKSCCDKK